MNEEALPDWSVSKVSVIIEALEKLPQEAEIYEIVPELEATEKGVHLTGAMRVVYRHEGDFHEETIRATKDAR